MSPRGVVLYARNAATSEEEEPDRNSVKEPCVESKLLALHTSTVCLARALLLSGALDRKTYHAELDMGRRWLAQFDHAGHNLQAFDSLLEMLKDI